MPPSTPRHHTEWLSLLEISGPFLSMPVLLSAFPQGLDDFPPEEARSLRADYKHWKENANDPATHKAWVRLVLESMLGYSGPVLLSGLAIPGGPALYRPAASVVPGGCDIFGAGKIILRH